MILNLGYCGPPPVIENAEASHSLNSSVGGKVFYVCMEGYSRISGDPYLTCTSTEDFKPSWTGSLMECSHTMNR